MNRDSFAYLQENDVATVFNSMCQAIIEDTPKDLTAYMMLWLTSQRTQQRGGIGLLLEDKQRDGHLFLYDHDGKQLCALDGIKLQDRNMLVAEPLDGVVYIAVREGQTSEIRKYKYNGDLLQTIRVGKRISAMCVDRTSHKIWTTFQGGSGAMFSNGVKVSDLAVPPVYSMDMHHTERVVFLMTELTVERRRVDTAAIDFVIHLYKETSVSNTIPYKVHVGETTLWTVHVHSDNTPAQVCAFDIATGGAVKKFTDSQAGSQLSYDPSRQGVWVLSGPHKIQFYHSGGIPTCSFNVMSGQNHALVTDGKRGFIWVVNSSLISDRVRLYLVDPLSQTACCQIDMPEMAVTNITVCSL